MKQKDDDNDKCNGKFELEKYTLGKLASLSPVKPGLVLTEMGEGMPYKGIGWKLLCSRFGLVMYW